MLELKTAAREWPRRRSSITKRRGVAYVAQSASRIRGLGVFATGGSSGVGNGTTDDLSSFKLALRAAPSDKLCFSSNRYNVVRSIPPKRAALDMFRSARAMRYERYS